MDQQQVYISGDTIDAELMKARQQLRQLTGEAERLRVRVEMLEDLRQSASPLSENGNVLKQPSVKPGDLPGPKQAIVDLLAKTPGLLIREVIEHLEGCYQTKSTDPRIPLYSTAHSLRKEGRIRRDNEGRLYLTEAGMP